MKKQTKKLEMLHDSTIRIRMRYIPKRECLTPLSKIKDRIYAENGYSIIVSNGGGGNPLFNSFAIHVEDKFGEQMHSALNAIESGMRNDKDLLRQLLHEKNELKRKSKS